MATPSPTQQRFIDAVRPEPSTKLEAMRERQRTRAARKQSAHLAVEVLCALDERGLSRAALAEHLTVTVEELDAWLKGKTLIGEVVVKKVVSWLGER